MPGRNARFCSSVPHCSSVGPTRVSPKKSTADRRLRPSELLGEHDPLHRRQSLAAVLLRPRRADPAALEQPLGPLDVEVRPLLVGHLEPVVEPACGQVFLEPRPDLGAELLGFGRVRQVHGHHSREHLTHGSSPDHGARDRRSRAVHGAPTGSQHRRRRLLRAAAPLPGKRHRSSTFPPRSATGTPGSGRPSSRSRPRAPLPEPASCTAPPPPPPTCAPPRGEMTRPATVRS